MGPNRAARMLAVFGVASLFLAACASSSTSTGPKGTVTIGGFNFNESTVLVNIYAKALQNKGYTVNLKTKLGSREVVEPALEKGDIDMYPGYAATDLLFIDKNATATSDGQQNADKITSTASSKNIKALKASDAQDENAFVVTKATADKYNLKKVSDLGSVASQLVLGGPPECPTRPFCLPGLKSTYGLSFKSFQPYDAGGPLTKAALEQGKIDVALLFSSDGSIAAKNWVLLEDDKHLEAADNVVPIIRNAAATDDVTNILNSVSAKLKTTDLINFNQRADINHDDPGDIATDWIKSNGF